MNSCLWCFTKIEEWRYITREERDVYEDQEMLATKTTYLPVMYFYFRDRIYHFAVTNEYMGVGLSPFDFVQDYFIIFTLVYFTYEGKILCQRESEQIKEFLKKLWKYLKTVISFLIWLLPKQPGPTIQEPETEILLEPVHNVPEQLQETTKHQTTVEKLILQKIAEFRKKQDFCAKIKEIEFNKQKQALEDIQNQQKEELKTEMEQMHQKQLEPITVKSRVLTHVTN